MTIFHIASLSFVFTTQVYLQLERQELVERNHTCEKDLQLCIAVLVNSQLAQHLLIKDES